MLGHVKNFIKMNSEKHNGQIFVLKGYSVKNFGYKQIEIDRIADNKIDRLLLLSQKENQVISFEEFICLYDLIVTQYKKIYILENGLFLNLFPTDIIIQSNISTALQTHFDSEADSESSIGEISEYTNIYSNYVATETGIACCYNIQDDALKNEKIERYIFGKGNDTLKETDILTEDFNYINICNEIDYFQLVQQLIETDKRFAVTWENYPCSKEIIEKKLQALSLTYQNRIYAYQKATVIEQRRCSKDIYKLLEKYWGFTSFRNLSVYDINELENRNKKVVKVSQESIICDLIEQTENCINKQNFRDVFVTAPTGSGKSLMFQVPAIYLAEKYNLLTIVVTPLIGLMNDQVQALNKKGYSYARTINSDIPPIIKQDILEQVADSKCHILYLSPESLLSRSDIEQLIGKRHIGMLVVDEAHIVTTWGKQFRPDYWYLGDHIQKLRKTQSRKAEDAAPFIIATFTATAIYEGAEDMYHETLNSLHMIDPITYLGYVRRDNISIDVSEVDVKRNKTEYEMNKFDSLISMIKTALMRGQKTLIYFPTVGLINRFYDYCYSKDLLDYVGKYHGQLDAGVKDESFKSFLSGEKQIMLATKAFGMGIDIPDIAIVAHFAPTGNVCDYMQEIGRAARDKGIEGYALYKHMSNDFKHINKLHGLSAIRKYQLVEVVKKVLELYTRSRYSKRNSTIMTKKRNEMLVDAESFAYIFEGPLSDENDLINKVKTAMLLIQKDYENRGFAPFHIRPIPLFAYGYFSVSPKEQEILNSKYNGAVRMIYHQKNVCEINLKNIWEKSYERSMSFPKFKYLLYSNSVKLDFNQKYCINPALSIEVYSNDNSEIIFNTIFEGLKGLTNLSIYQGKYLAEQDMVNELVRKCSINRYRSESIIGVFLAAVDLYRREFSKRLNARMYSVRITKGEKVSYQFANAIREFFGWLRRGYTYITKNTKNNKMYILDEDDKSQRKQIMTVLGILESMGVLRFKSLGGSNSQIYIYVNETKNMQIVRDKPQFYKNQLLDMINKRHEDSVRMLTFLFQSSFTSEEIWNHLENYFLGIIPEAISIDNNVRMPDPETTPVLLQIGENLKDDYKDWKDANVLFDNDAILKFSNNNIPLAEYYAAKLILGDNEIEALLAWPDKKTIISSGEEKSDLRNAAEQSDWHCVPINKINISNLQSYLGVLNNG